MRQPIKKEHIKIVNLAEENNEKFRESKKDIYLRIKREKKFLWRVWYRLKDTFK